MHDISPERGRETRNAHSTAEVRTIGEILSKTRDLSADQVARILAHQQANGTRFGESAISLGYVESDDVLSALSEQFNYTSLVRADSTLSEELICLRDPFSKKAEQIRRLRGQLFGVNSFSAVAPKRLAIVSAETGDGKTYVAANLAIALGQTGQRTLLIDADLRSPRLSSLFSVKIEAGFESLLQARKVEGAIKAIGYAKNLYLLGVGAIPPNPSELIEGVGLDILLHELGHKFDRIIVDTPAYSWGRDAVVIGQKVDSTLVIARDGITGRASLAKLREDLTNANVNVAGALLNATV